MMSYEAIQYPSWWHTDERAERQEAAERRDDARKVRVLERAAEIKRRMTDDDRIDAIELMHCNIDVSEAFTKALARCWRNGYYEDVQDMLDTAADIWARNQAENELEEE